MVASDFQYGCLMQNLANELPALDAELTKRVARVFVDSTEIAAQHFRKCGFSPARASSTAAALVAALEGARTIARPERTPAIFEALAGILSASSPNPNAPTADDLARVSVEMGHILVQAIVAAPANQERTEPPKDVLDSLHAVFTRNGIASYTDYPHLATDIIHWACEMYRQSKMPPQVGAPARAAEEKA